MANETIFVSYDYDNDKRNKNLVIGGIVQQLIWVGFFIRELAY